MAPLPPPPPPPPRLPPPPPPATAMVAPALGGHIYDHERSRWGLGDAFIAFAIYLTISISILVIYLTLEGTDSTPRDFWLPLLVVAPAACQFVYVVWLGKHRGTGVLADFRAQVRPSDAAVGAALCVSALILAGITAQIMTEIAGEAPTAAVADLIEESTESGGGSTDGAPGEGNPGGSGTITSSGSTSNLTIWIYLLAFLGATFIPVAEELLFRGLWWSALEKRGVHQIWSLLITSAVFAGFHFEPWRTPVLFVLGAVIGLGRIATGRIGASIFAHMYVNAMGMIFLLIELS